MKGGSTILHRYKSVAKALEGVVSPESVQYAQGTIFIFTDLDIPN